MWRFSCAAARTGSCASRWGQAGGRWLARVWTLVFSIGSAPRRMCFLSVRGTGWNTRMEELTAIRREDALGRKLEELFPANLMEHVERARGESGICHIDKFVLRSWGGNGHGSNGFRAAREVTLNVAIAPLVSRH